MDEKQIRAKDEGLLVKSLMKGVVTRLSSDSERSQKSAANVLGVSDIGVCREKARRQVLNEQPTQWVSKYDLASFIGTAIGYVMESQIAASTAWRQQDEVEVKLRVRGWELTIVGHPDLYSQCNLIDFKTKNGLGVVRKNGPSDKERFQTALYAGALIRAGKMDENNCYLHLAYIDRSGEDGEPVIWSRPFSWAEFTEAEAWLDDVIYAVEMGEEASRDKPREWCWAACEYAPACRGDDTDVEGLITDREVIDALKVRAEAMETIKVADKDKKSAESVLRRFSGSTGEWIIRSIDIPETVVPEQRRAGYTRLDIRPVRARKQPVRKQRETGSTAPDEPRGEGTVAGGPA